MIRIIVKNLAGLLLLSSAYSFGLTPFSDEELDSQVAEGWSRPNYLNCLDSYEELENLPEASDEFLVKFGFIMGVVKDCDFKVLELENRLYKLGNKDLKFGFLINPILNKKYEVKTVLYSPQDNDIPLLEHSCQRRRASIALAGIEPGDPIGKYRIELFINEKLVSTKEFEVH